MTKTTFFGLMCSIVLIGGCVGSPSSEDNTDTLDVDMTVTESSVKTVGQPICDAYLSTLHCIYNTLSGSDATQFGETIDSVYQSFENVPVDQMIQTCTILSQSLTEHPTILQEHAECNVLLE